ncbi:hypothetical protein ACGFJC_47440 [Nonomuraea fuscirosea]
MAISTAGSTRIRAARATSFGGRWPLVTAVTSSAAALDTPAGT